MPGYHMNVFQSAKTHATRLGLTLEPLGGGRMQYTRPRSTSGTVANQQQQWDSEEGGDLVPSVQWGTEAGAASRGTGAARCLIFGYSVAFGSAPHEVAAAIVKRWHPFAEVAIAYEGY